MSVVKKTRQVTYGRLWLVGLLAAISTAVINTIVFLVGSTQGVFPSTVTIPPMGMPITLPPVVFTSIMGVIGGVVAYAIIGRLAKNPVRVFRIVAGIVLVLSFGAPLSIPNAPSGLYAALEVMHLVAGGITIWSLTTYASRIV